MILTIRDESATGSVTHELTLDVLSETMTVRELIRSRVYQEVQDYNLKRRTGTGEFRGLVTPTDAERTLNGASAQAAGDRLEGAVREGLRRLRAQGVLPCDRRPPSQVA